MLGLIFFSIIAQNELIENVKYRFVSGTTRVLVHVPRIHLSGFVGQRDGSISKGHFQDFGCLSFFVLESSHLPTLLQQREIETQYRSVFICMQCSSRGVLGV